MGGACRPLHLWFRAWWCCGLCCTLGCGSSCCLLCNRSACSRRGWTCCPPQPPAPQCFHDKGQAQHQGCGQQAKPPLQHLGRFPQHPAQAQHGHSTCTHQHQQDAVPHSSSTHAQGACGAMSSAEEPPDHLSQSPVPQLDQVSWLERHTPRKTQRRLLLVPAAVSPHARPQPGTLCDMCGCTHS